MTDPIDVRPMVVEDAAWAAAVMDERRALYARLSPVLWRPADDVTELHTAFLGWVISQPHTTALRTDHAFLIGVPDRDDACFVDDFAVDDVALWPTHGRELLAAAWAEAADRGAGALRVVTGTDDTPKRRLLADAGLVVDRSWWVRALGPDVLARDEGEVVVGGAAADLLRAPPVYDPGGLVCLVEHPTVESVDELASDAEVAGAVLAVVEVRSGGTAGDLEAALATHGFASASQFRLGIPT